MYSDYHQLTSKHQCQDRHYLHLSLVSAYSTEHSSIQRLIYLPIKSNPPKLSTPPIYSTYLSADSSANLSTNLFADLSADLSLICQTYAHAICSTNFFWWRKKIRRGKLKFRRQKIHFYFKKSIFRQQNFTFQQRFFFRR